MQARPKVRSDTGEQTDGVGGIQTPALPCTSYGAMGLLFNFFNPVSLVVEKKKRQNRTEDHTYVAGVQIK